MTVATVVSAQLEFLVKMTVSALHTVEMETLIQEKPVILMQIHQPAGEVVDFLALPVNALPVEMERSKQLLEKPVKQIRNVCQRRVLIPEQLMSAPVTSVETTL